MPKTKRDWVYFILGGFFIANAILAELTGGKLFSPGGFSMGWFQIDEVLLPIGLLPWPIVFIITDLVNEYFGKEGVRKLTFLTMGLIAYCFVIIFLADVIPASPRSPIPDKAFHQVFGQSLWLISGSIIAFGVSQLVDVWVFSAFKEKTGPRMLWLRATGSTTVSQLVDTFIVQYIGFVLPGKLGFHEFLPLAIASYAYKLAIAIGITPLIYLAHRIIDKYLAESKPATKPPSKPSPTAP